MKTTVTAILLLVSVSVISAADTEINASIKGFTLHWAKEYSQGKNFVFPRVTSQTEKKARICVILKYNYPITKASDGAPTDFAHENLGCELFITTHEQGKQIRFDGILNLSKLYRLRDPGTPIQKIITPFSGVIDSGGTAKIPTVSPDGKAITLCLNIKKV